LDGLNFDGNSCVPDQAKKYQFSITNNLIGYLETPRFRQREVKSKSSPGQQKIYSANNPLQKRS